jgi:hypothetical protein
MQHKHEWFEVSKGEMICDICGLIDPDYEPDDNEMPNVAAVTDPWETSGPIESSGNGS